MAHEALDGMFCPPALCNVSAPNAKVVREGWIRSLNFPVPSPPKCPFEWGCGGGPLIPATTLESIGELGGHPKLVPRLVQFFGSVWRKNSFQNRSNNCQVVTSSWTTFAASISANSAPMLGSTEAQHEPRYTIQKRSVKQRQ